MSRVSASTTHRIDTFRNLVLLRNVFRVADKGITPLARGAEA
jgi:hypothetical protein